MNGFLTIIKMNSKLLLRNKGYLAFLFILPVISVIMLTLNNTETLFAQQNTTTIYELKSETEQILSVSSDKMSVKVIDCSKSTLSDYLLNELTKTGSFRLYRYKENDITPQKAREYAINSANHGSIALVVYIPADFEESMLNGEKNNIVLFKARKDERIALFESNLRMFQNSLYNYAEISGFQKEKTEDLIEQSVSLEMKKENINIEVGDELNLTSVQKGASSSISYSLSFLTIGFLFCGVFISATVIEERKNRVYNRFLLSTASILNYGLAKLVMVLISTLIQTGIIAIAIKLIVRNDFGIAFGSYLFLVFCLGLIFNLYSVIVGVITNNVMTSNYIVFLTWTMSCLLAGLYFPLDAASKWWERVSMLMPQRWVVKSSEMLMAGKTGVYTMFLLVVGAYLIVIMSVGLLGIKIRRKE